MSIFDISTLRGYRVRAIAPGHAEVRCGHEVVGRVERTANRLWLACDASGQCEPSTAFDTRRKAVSAVITADRERVLAERRARWEGQP